MNYELAKKLKDAGFKQEGSGLLMNGNVYALGFSEPTGDMYYPTLSELIEACGESFYNLVKQQVWVARAYNEIEDEYVGTGNTPEEAVAELWLALNKTV